MSAAQEMPLRRLDPQTANALRLKFKKALDAGWSSDELNAVLAAKGVTKEQYDRAAKNGESVPDDIAGTLEALSIHLELGPREAQPSAPLPDADAIRAHLEWLVEPARGAYDDALVEIVWSPVEGLGWRARLFGLDELDQAAALAVARNLAGDNLYLGGALKTPDAPRDRRANASHFYVATAVPADVDENHDEVRARIDAACEVGLEVVTGLTPAKRAQVWVRLAEPCDDGMEFEHAFAALVSHVGADQRVHDRARIMRLGGTVNHPKADKLARGYAVEATTVGINPDARRTTIEALISLAPGARPGQKFDASSRPKVSGIHRAGLGGMCGPVVDGREEHFRNLILEHLHAFQRSQNADPTTDQLWEATWLRFSDPDEVDNSDGRWTSGEGLQMLQRRVVHTLRRLREGSLARWGFWSRETGAGREEAERYEANRRETERPAYAAGVAPGPDEEEPEPQPPPGDAPEEGEPASAAADGKEEPRSSDAPGNDNGADEPRPTLLFDPWGKWMAPGFPLEAVPPVIRDYAEQLSLSTGGDLGACVMSCLAVCSAAASHEWKLKMRRHGSWAVSPRLWVLLVAPSSWKKSPIMSNAVAPLRHQDTKYAEQHDRDLARWNEAKERGEKEPKPPPCLQLMINQTTGEAAAQTLTQQNRGALVYREELSGWIGSMDKFANGGKGGAVDRAFWLQTYDGGPGRIDTISRGRSFMANCSVSFLGGIQPARLEEMGCLTSDGLLQRFVPVLMRRPDRDREVDDRAASEAYNGLVAYMVDMRPAQLVMDDPAMAAIREFQDWLFDLQLVEGLGESFLSFLGKLNGLVGSLALLLHLVANPAEAPYSPVGEQCARSAARILRDFAIPHALELYKASADGVDWDHLRSIASYILTSTKERFVVSDFTTGVHALRGQGVWEVNKRISPLVAGGWLTEEADRGGVVKAWGVLPGLREVFAERRADEARRKEEVMRAYREMKGAAA